MRRNQFISTKLLPSVFGMLFKTLRSEFRSELSKHTKVVDKNGSCFVCQFSASQKFDLSDTHTVGLLHILFCTAIQTDRVS